MACPLCLRRLIANDPTACTRHEPWPKKEMLRFLYGYTCLFPGCRTTDVNVHRVVPVRQGGLRSNIVNLQLLCSHHASNELLREVDYRPDEVVTRLAGVAASLTHCETCLCFSDIIEAVRELQAPIGRRMAAGRKRMELAAGNSDTAAYDEAYADWQARKAGHR